MYTRREFFQRAAAGSARLEHFIENDVINQPAVIFEERLRLSVFQVVSGLNYDSTFMTQSHDGVPKKRGGSYSISFSFLI